MFLLAIAVLTAPLGAQEFPNATVETIVKDAHFAEGPVWSLEGFLLFSDTVTDRINKWAPGKGKTEYASRPGAPPATPTIPTAASTPASFESGA